MNIVVENDVIKPVLIIEIEFVDTVIDDVAKLVPIIEIDQPVLL